MSSQKHETATKKRVLEILRMLIENPGYYTRKKLSKVYSVSIDTISRDFEDIQNAGFDLNEDAKHRYFLSAEKANELIKALLLFSEKEKELISESLTGNVSENERKNIINKLESIANLPRLGNIIFTKPYLNKIALLNKARNEKQKVILFNYKSTNSNTKKDRIIEPFQVEPEDDILHAYDLEINEIRHFRISRIERIEQLNEDWENEGKHYVMATDIFKISDKKQVPVHIRLRIGGYNELIERYPLARAALSPAPDKEDEYDLVCKVNHRFYGLQNFLLGYSHYVVEIVESDSLRKHMTEKLKNIRF